MNALRFAGRRIARILVITMLVSLAAMVLVNLVPGSAAQEIAGESAPKSQIALLNHQMGLDRPFLSQYTTWLGDLAQGNLGSSVLNHEPVWDAIKQRLPVTLEIAIVAMLLAIMVSVPAGIYAAYREGRFFDRAMLAVSSAFISIPGFVLALLLAYLFAVKLKVFPVVGWTYLTADLGENLRHVALPALTIALVEAPIFARLMRNDMVLTLREDYVLAARARGLPPRTVLLRHALRPSSFSLLTVFGVTFARTLGGTVIVEQVFALPGLGSTAVTAINTHDFTLVRGIVVVIALVYVGVNALVDLAYPLLDPRIRVQ